MLYVLHQGNHPDLSYRDGQASILHLEADFYATVAWAQKKRWAFTTSNAGSRFFENYADLTHLDKIDWSAVQARDWQRCKDGKQAEFLLEQRFPWQLIERIGVLSHQIYERVANIIPRGGHRPTIEIRPDWYY
jgi:hypothetical protein